MIKFFKNFDKKYFHNLIDDQISDQIIIWRERERERALIYCRINYSLNQSVGFYLWSIEASLTWLMIG